MLIWPQVCKTVLNSYPLSEEREKWLLMVFLEWKNPLGELLIQSCFNYWRHIKLILTQSWSSLSQYLCSVGVPRLRFAKNTEDWGSFWGKLHPGVTCKKIYNTWWPRTPCSKYLADHPPAVLAEVKLTTFLSSQWGRHTAPSEIKALF